MLEYIAEALPGESLLPEAPYDLYRAHASGQFLGAQSRLAGAHPGLPQVPRAATRGHGPQRARREARRRRAAGTSQQLARLLDGTYTPQILATARERLKFPVARIEETLAEGAWLAGPRYSIADIDAFAMLRVIPDLAPDS